jgi:hypothetical protein
MRNVAVQGEQVNPVFVPEPKVLKWVFNEITPAAVPAPAVLAELSRRTRRNYCTSQKCNTTGSATVLTVSPAP